MSPIDLIPGEIKVVTGPSSLFHRSLVCPPPSLSIRLLFNCGRNQILTTVNLFFCAFNTTAKMELKENLHPHRIICHMLYHFILCICFCTSSLTSHVIHNYFVMKDGNLYRFSKNYFRCKWCRQPKQLGQLHHSTAKGTSSHFEAESPFFTFFTKLQWFIR